MEKLNRVHFAVTYIVYSRRWSVLNTSYLDRKSLIYSSPSGSQLGWFLQRVSIASYAKRCISHDRFCLTV